MRVKLIFPEVEVIRSYYKPLIYLAAKTCYSSRLPDEIWADVLEGRVPSDSVMRVISHVVSSGHHSTIEHISFTFAISGVSRALSHQLVRHRIGVAFDQQSQRYVKYREPHFVMPPSIEGDAEARELFESFCRESERVYHALLERGVPAEDARYVFPNAVTTNLVMTVNFRQLIHMAGLRLCTLAQWEIRRLFKLIRKELMAADPFFGRLVTPKCVWKGYCDERRNADGHCRIRPYRPSFVESTFFGGEE